MVAKNVHFQEIKHVFQGNNNIGGGGGNGSVSSGGGHNPGGDP